MTALPPMQQVPQNIEAEQALLGVLLCNNGVIDDAFELKPEHFYHEAHRAIFAAIRTMIERGEQANPITLRAFFERDALLDKIGGVQYLARLAGCGMGLAFRDYVKAVFETAMLRRLIERGTELIAMASTPNLQSGASEILRQHVASLEEAEDAEIGQGLKTTSLHEAMQLGIKDADRAARGERAGLATGIEALDAIYGGLGPGDLVILAGRPSMGKSAIAQVISFNVAIADTEQTPRGVMFFQLEMSDRQMGQRALAWASGEPYDDMRKGRTPDTAFQKLHLAAQRARRLHYEIVDAHDLRVSQLRAALRRFKRKHPLSLVVIDYLQLLQPENTYRGNRVAEISEISGSLKKLGREFGIPILALSQLSRDLEKREDKRPMLSDLRESGAIEQDADAVLFVYRPEYYLERSAPKPGTEKHMEWVAELENSRGVAEIIVQKQRMGPIGTARVHFDAARNRVRSLDQEDGRQADVDI
jgi:replicative DNA helicase